MKKKKLFIVIWDLGPGGIQKRMRDVALEINRKHLDWEVYFLTRKKVEDSFESALINKNNIHMMYYPLNKIPRTLYIFPFWLLLKYIIYRPDVIVSFLAHYASAVALIRILAFWHKSIFIINEGVITSEYLRLNNFNYLKPLVKTFYKTANKIIVPTRACQTDLINNFQVNQSLIEVIPSWSLVRRRSYVKKVYDLIFIGRLTDEKDPLSFIKVVEEIHKHNKHVRALIIGKGVLKQDLLKTIREYKLENNITHIEFSSDVIKWLSKSKILVLTSKNEGMPNVVLEAALCQVPSVVNNFSGSDELINHGKTGYIASSNQEMVVYINKLLRHERLWQKISSLAKYETILNNSFNIQQKFVKTLLIR